MQNMGSKIITVFGGANPKPGEEAYKRAEQLGMLLANNGCTVMTGGYYGTMEAVSKGAAENGGYVIGVTCGEIEAFRIGKANAWVQEEIRKPTLTTRLETLIRKCDAAIALPGGAGTLVEISLLWNLMLIGSVPIKPLVLIGDGWKKVFTTFFDELNEYLPENKPQFCSFAKTEQEALTIVLNGLG